MIFGEREKFINISFKLPFRVGIITICHIVMITLIAPFFFVGIAIATPSPIEEPSAIPRNKGAEFFNSNLQIRKDRLQPWLNSPFPFFRPFGRQWIEARESFKSRTSKFCRSGAPSIQFPNIKQRPNSNKGTDQHSDNGSKNFKWNAEDFQWVPLAGLIPIIIFLIDSIYRLTYHSTKAAGKPWKF